MKISQTPTPPRPAATTGSSGSGRAGGAARTSSTASGGSTAPAADAGAAARLTQLETQFAQADFNASKVSEISAAISAGRYQVDAGAVADKLLASAAALAGARN